MNNKAFLGGLDIITGGSLSNIIESMEKKYEGIGKQKREVPEEIQKEKIRKAEEKRARKLERKINGRI